MNTVSRVTLIIRHLFSAHTTKTQKTLKLSCMGFHVVDPLLNAPPANMNALECGGKESIFTQKFPMHNICYSNDLTFGIIC
jgi:hypothetical protein